LSLSLFPAVSPYKDNASGFAGVGETAVGCSGPFSLRVSVFVTLDDFLSLFLTDFPSGFSFFPPMVRFHACTGPTGLSFFLSRSVVIMTESESRLIPLILNAYSCFSLDLIGFFPGASALVNLVRVVLFGLRLGTFYGFFISL